MCAGGAGCSLLLWYCFGACGVIYWQYGECWQTGQLGAESHSCEKVTAAGYLATHTIYNGNRVEDLKLKKSGQYCSFRGLLSTFGAEETARFEVPSPAGSYQEGDGLENVCAVWAPTKEAVLWGLQLNNNPKGGDGRSTSSCEEVSPSERCSMEHYFSAAGQELNDRPWASYFSYPILTLRDYNYQNSLMAFQPGEIGGGWGYMCPVLEDDKSGDILEVCFEEWIGYGTHTKKPPNLGLVDASVAQCENSSGSFSHNHDRIIKKTEGGELEATKEIFDVLTDEPPKESQFPTETRYKMYLEAKAMQEIAELDNHTFKASEKSGGFEKEPEIGYGCGRSASTNPAEWALIGVENGVEEWNTNKEPQQPERTDTGLERATQEPPWVYTEFTPHEIEIPSETATKATETEATVTGEVNPFGFATSYLVEYGTASVGEHTTTETPIGSGTAAARQRNRRRANFGDLDESQTKHDLQISDQGISHDRKRYQLRSGTDVLNSGQAVCGNRVGDRCEQNRRYFERQSQSEERRNEILFRIRQN
jgi:hypothetical protein